MAKAADLFDSLLLNIRSCLDAVRSQHYLSTGTDTFDFRWPDIVPLQKCRKLRVSLSRLKISDLFCLFGPQTLHLSNKIVCLTASLQKRTIIFELVPLGLNVAPCERKLGDHLLQRLSCVGWPEREKYTSCEAEQARR